MLGAIVGPLATAAIAVAWELKDAVLPWEAGVVTRWPVVYNWGGDGFSWRDLVATIVGGLISALLF